MPAIELDAAPAFVRGLARAYPLAVKRAARAAAARGVGIVVETIERTQPFKPVNTGGYRASWKHEATALGARVYSDHPVAGIIERGARPHRIGWSTEAGRSLRRWCARKFGKEDGDRVAHFIRKRIAERGMAPRRVAERSVPRIAQAFVEEALREVGRVVR